MPQIMLWWAEALSEHPMFCQIGHQNDTALDKIDSWRMWLESMCDITSDGDGVLSYFAEPQESKRLDSLS